MILVSKFSNLCIMKTVRILSIVFFVIVFLACDREEITNVSEYSEIAVRGVSGEGIESESHAPHEHPIILTGSNIQWFNARTREIKLNNISFKPNYYQKFIFEINGEELFSATYTNPASSITCNDLILYQDIPKGKFYLYDGYPSWTLNQVETKENIMKRKEGWDKFLTQLQKEGRLRK